MKLQRIAQQAKRYPEMVFNNVGHVRDREFVREAYRQTQKGSAPGLDQGTAPQDAEHLDEHLRDLHERLRANRYVAPPVERVWSEKEDGKRRPIGTPCCEDKLVQRAVVMILEALFAHDLHAFAHGCRKGHSPHQALHELREQCRTLHINWRVDAEVSGFFDHLAWSHLRACIQRRVSDGGLRRLLGKWLHAGVLEAGVLRHRDPGTPQGGGISPMLANVFLPHVLDEWFVKDVQPRLQGRGFLTRLADDFIIGGELEADARRVMKVLAKRCSRFRLTMHPDKTVLVEFKKPPYRERAAHSQGPCACLGFTHSWAQTRRGYWVIKRKTVGKRLRRFMKERWAWCREQRHAPLKEQDRTLGVTLRGDSQYYGRRGNCKMLEVVFEHPERAGHYWLSRRSHTGHVNWQKFEGFRRQT
jgi:group II intron reverse transcriptase/maturase